MEAIGIDSRISIKWDYEAELALVIGKKGRSIRLRKLQVTYSGIFSRTISLSVIFSGATMGNGLKERASMRRRLSVPTLLLRANSIFPKSVWNVCPTGG